MGKGALVYAHYRGSPNNVKLHNLAAASHLVYGLRIPSGGSNRFGLLRTAIALGYLGLIKAPILSPAGELRVQHHASVYIEDRTVNVIRVIRGKPDHGPAYILGLSEALVGNQ